jgi:hypothetical protein
VQVHLTVTLIYDLDEEVPPTNVPDRHSKSRKTSRKEKPAVQTRSSSIKLKRPPQDSVARKPYSKDQIPKAVIRGTRKVMFTPNVSKTMIIMETEKDLALSCFNCVLRDAEVGGDLLFAAQIMAGIILNAYP